MFVVVPILELYVIVQVAQGVGVFPTVAGVIVVSAVGAWLCKREGAGLFRKIQRQLNAGELPTDTVVDGFLVLFAGALLLTPGFLTDLVGLALLVAPVRALVRGALLARFASVARRRAADAVRSRTRVVSFGFGDSGFGDSGDSGQRDGTAGGNGGRIIDVGEATHWAGPGVGETGDRVRGSRTPPDQREGPATLKRGRRRRPWRPPAGPNSR